MKVLLTTLNAKYIHLNLAVRLLYTLNKEREGLEWHEFTIREETDNIAQYCKDFEVVAFSCYIWNITRTLEVAAAIKKRNPECKILLGGPEVSYENDHIIALPQVDYLITGEGEIPFAAFLEHYPDLSAVPNIIYKNDGGVVRREEQLTFDLECYRNLNPYFFDTPESLKHKVAYIETSRGCPYKCEFCLASLDNKVRYLPIETIRENLLYLMKNGKVIKFLDRTFNVKKDFTIDIFRFILEHHRPGNVFQFEITADIVHPDIIRFIQDHVPVGLFRFEIGIQTVNQQANLQVKRKQDFEKTAAVIRQLQDKIEMHLDLIVGLPLDYFGDIRNSVNAVFSLYPPELQLGFLKFLKGTPMRFQTEKHGYVYDPMPPYQMIESNYLSGEELSRILQAEEALEIYWNKKRAVHTLRYIHERHGVFDFLLGLGAYFESRSSFHKHTMRDVYDILNDFIRQLFPDDVVLHQLMAIDYYLHDRMKPQVKYVMEADHGRMASPTDAPGVKAMVLDLSFDYEAFQQKGEVVTGQYQAVIRYDNKSKPVLSLI